MVFKHFLVLFFCFTAHDSKISTNYSLKRVFGQKSIPGDDEGLGNGALGDLQIGYFGKMC